MLQIIYTAGLYPTYHHELSTAPFGYVWWNLFGRGAFAAVVGVLLRELYFSELLERHPQP